MPIFKPSIELQKKIQNKALDIFIKKNGQDIIEKFQEIKYLMISEFLKHPITVEINAGTYSSNTSGTLSGIDNGNLFSFIGFELGTNPIEPIEDILNDIEIKIIKSYNLAYISINKFPKPEDVWKITPMPWQEGRSWAKGIESGISGLNYYFYSKTLNDNDSRSGTAVQFKNKQVRSYARYIPRQYISTLLKKYKKIFQSKYSKNKSIFVNI